MTYATFDGGPSRRALLAAGGATVLAGALGACTAPAVPLLAIALIDQTASVRAPDWESYRNSFANLVNSLRPGEDTEDADKLVVAAITAAPLSQFTTTFEGEIVDDGTQGGRAKAETRRQEMIKVFDSPRQGAAPQQTRLLESLAGVEEILKADTRRKALCLVCSDMIEDSSFGRFDRNPPDGIAAARLLERLRDEGLLPNFRGARVLVSGAGGSDGAAYETLKRFWSGYFAAANATLVSYARAPADFSADESTQD